MSGFAKLTVKALRALAEEYEIQLPAGRITKGKLIEILEGEKIQPLGMVRNGNALLAKHVGVKPACAALEVSRSTLYRRRGPSTGQQQPRPTPARALSETERGEVFDTLCSERFVDRSPAPRCSTKRSTCAANARCIVFWPPRCRFRNAGRSAPIPSTRSPS